MTRGVLLAWLGAGVAALAILAALFWPMNASVAPLPAAEASVASPSAVPALPPVVAAPLEQTATTDARGRVVRTPNQTPAAVAPAAPPRRSDPAPAPVPVEKPLEPSAVPPGGGGTGDSGDNSGGDGNNDGNRGRPDFGDFFPGG